MHMESSGTHSAFTLRRNMKVCIDPLFKNSTDMFFPLLWGGKQTYLVDPYYL